MQRTIAALLTLVLFAACGGRTVERIDVDTVADLSGNWNDTDSRLVSEEMVMDCLNRPWIIEFRVHEQRKPVVTVGLVRNRSHEHINVETFTTDIERELINSGRVSFVASQEDRQEIRGERMDQQHHASDATAKRLAQETGADYVMQGAISTIVDQIEGQRIVYYQTDLELIHVETNEKAWIGTKKIKKEILQPGKKW